MLPEQVKEAGRKADELIKQQQEGKTADDPEKGPGPAPHADDDDARKASDAAGSATPPNRSEEEDWKTRYQVLEGKYRSEVPALQRRIREIETRHADLLAEHSALQREVIGKKGDAAAPKNAAAALDPERFADYGEEFQELVRQFQTQAGELQAARDELAALKGQVGDVSSRQDSTADQAFETRLDQALPEWRAWNADARWLRWLEQEEPASGLVRQVILDHAGKQRDVGRIVKLFRLWHESLGETPPRDEDKGKGKAATPDPKKGLEELIAPGGGRGGEAPQGKPTYTTKDIREFYQRKSRGDFAGKEAEATAMEQDILLASREGRIRG